MGLQGGQGPRLILTHETAVPCGVGAEDNGKLPVSLFSGQRDSPMSFHFQFDEPSTGPKVTGLRNQERENGNPYVDREGILRSETKSRARIAPPITGWSRDCLEKR
jgi:hypothetical protein